VDLVDAEEVVMKGKDIEDALLELGRKRGVLFFNELDDAFPEDHFPLQEIEHLLMRLEDLGVRVVEKEERAKPKPRQRRRAA
jgi:hypothetical protein